MPLTGRLWLSAHPVEAGQMGSAARSGAQLN